MTQSMVPPSVSGVALVRWPDDTDHLDRLRSQGRPRLLLVDNYDGGCAIIVRIHHCYADGLALVQVMLSLTDAAAQAAVKADAGKGWRPRDRGGRVVRRDDNR